MPDPIKWTDDEEREINMSAEARRRAAKLIREDQEAAETERKKKEAAEPKPKKKGVFSGL